MSPIQVRLSRWAEWGFERAVMLYVGTLATLAFLPIVLFAWLLERKSRDD